MANDKPRPSSLPNLEACPRWVSRPRTEKLSSMDEAADEGTLVHAKMEALAEIPTDKWEETVWADPDLGPALAPVVLEAANQVRDLFSMGLPVVTKKRMGMPADSHYELGCVALTAVLDPIFSERTEEEYPYPRCYPFNNTIPVADAIYCEVGLDPQITRPGTADLLVVMGNRAALVDYKSNRVIREHRAQMYAYVIGAFNALPRVEYVEVRIVAPRLGNAHAVETYSRAEDLPSIKAELEAIVAKAADPFEPGCPGEQCATCAGNGRCPYQCASLKDVPVEVSALVQPNAWLPMLNAVTPENRGQRRKLVKWLGDFCEAVKEQDKEWAIAFPDEELPGFTKSVQAGRASLDKTRLAEVNESLRLRFGLTAEVMAAFSVPDKEQLAEYVALGQGMTQADAETAIKQCMAPYQKRGTDIIAFRAVKPKKGELKA